MRDGDRRVRYTKMMLKQNMIELLKQKPVGRISVTELCQAADVNRGTFYAHYADPADLLQEMQDELYNDIMNSLNIGMGGGDIIDMCRAIVAALDRNRDFCRVALSDNSNMSFLENMLNLAYGFFIASWSPKEAAPRDISDYAFRYMSAGSIDVIRRWLKQDDSRSNEDIAQIIAEMSVIISDVYLVRKK